MTNFETDDKYVIYQQDKGFLCEDEDIIGNKYSHELDEYTVFFSTFEEVRKNAEIGESILKLQFSS